MRCPACAAENPESHRFCGQCGAPLSKACPTCGASVLSGQRFCGGCGTELSLAVSATDHEARPGAAQRVDGPEAERRLVSALFADLVGFTTLSEVRDAEEVRDLLSRYYEVCRAAVERYGGTVDKFIGDGVLAVWGTPSAHEDDAERAVRCALDLIDEVSVLGVEVGAPELAARGGVMTGEVAVSLGASGEGVVAGDLVNTASRLQSVAEAGSVFVGEATFGATFGAIAFEELGPLALKGRDEPVRAWKALRVIAKRKGAGRPEAIEAPFVGRDEELQVLKEALHALSRDRRARLISVTGIPGIGKSRLSWELLKYADGLAETIYWHLGRSPAYGEGISFWALAEMVRVRASVAEDEDTASARQRVVRMVADFVADEEERAWIEPRLMHLVGLAGAPPGSRDETFSAWRRFFEHVAARAPVVMIFEDLQWADSGLIDYIESILEWSRNEPILVVTLARPELLERRPTWGAGQRSFVSIHLDPLSAQPMRRLLDGLVRDLPERFADKVLERAEGVPLYAVETARMLAGKGLLVESNGAYEVAGELSELEVPETLQALIASRLDALPVVERSLLQDAAVIGKSFSIEALVAVSGRTREDLESELRDLVRKELLSIDSDPRSPERSQYGFLQGLIREVSYGTLARKERRAKHLSAAHHFESLGDDELAGVVAAHYLEAHRASPDGPERDALAARARDSLADAGRRALSLGSPEQSLSYFEQALEVASAGAERAELAELAGRAAGQAAMPERGFEHYRNAIADYEAARDATSTGRAIARAAELLGHGLDRISEAVEWAEGAFDKLGEDADPRVRADLAAVLAGLFGHVGRQESALEWAERSLVLAEQMDEPKLLVSGILHKAGALFDLGRHREAVILARGGVVIAEAAGELEEEAHGLVALSVFVYDDDPREALAASKRAVQASRRAGDRGAETINLLNSAEFAVLLGEWAEAAAAIAEVDALGLPEDIWNTDFRDSCRALLLGFTGDSDGAFRIFDEVGVRNASSEYTHRRATYLWHRALVSLLSGDPESAFVGASAAVETDPGINSPSALQIRARAALWLHDADAAKETLSLMSGFRGRKMAAARLTTEAGLAALGGRVDEASATYEAARRAWTAIDSPLDLALCELDMVALVGVSQLAIDLVADARRSIALLDAPPLLERLEQFGASKVAQASST